MANTNVASYISPNAASIIGVLVAAVAARFFAREELKYRQFGVLLFKVGITIMSTLLESVTQYCPPSGTIIQISCHWLTHWF